ncbi:MAG: hypothetical protein ABID09_05125 [Candidatus Omnitrophota bacterium]
MKEIKEKMKILLLKYRIKNNRLMNVVMIPAGKPKTNHMKKVGMFRYRKRTFSVAWKSSERRLEDLRLLIRPRHNTHATNEVTAMIVFIFDIPQGVGF